jgi:hypothetical protein
LIGRVGQITGANSEEENMDIGRSFAFVFEDENWIVKILLAAAILLLGVVFSWVLAIPLIVAMLFVSGYSVEITRRVIQGHPDELPEWDNWGALFGDGVKVWVIGIVYALPILVVSICLGIPMGLLAEDAEGLVTVLSLILSCLSLVWAIVMSVVLPAAIAFYVAEDELGAAFRFADIFAVVRSNLKTYLVTFVMSWVANLVGSLGSLVCGVGWLVTGPYAWFVTGHLYGQAYLEGTGQTLQPVLEEDLA